MLYCDGDGERKNSQKLIFRLAYFEAYYFAMYTKRKRHMGNSYVQVVIDGS